MEFGLSREVRTENGVIGLCKNNQRWQLEWENSLGLHSKITRFLETERILIKLAYFSGKNGGVFWFVFVLDWKKHKVCNLSRRSQWNSKGRWIFYLTFFLEQVNSERFGKYNINLAIWSTLSKFFFFFFFSIFTTSRPSLMCDSIKKSDFVF